MKRIKPKWLLGATTVALTVAVFAVSVLAATPEYLNITSPTAAAWLARKPGASVTLTFDYTSNPSVPPTTTRALARMCRVGADPGNPDLDTVIVEAWQDIPNGTGLSASINLTIPASQPEGSYDARVVLTNSDGGPITDWEVGAIIVDNSAPNAPATLSINDDVNPGPDGYINATTPTFTWTAATDNGNPASGIAKYWIQIDGKFTWREVVGTTYTVPVLDALADGAYIARVKAEDKAGNVGPEATINFTVDTAAPGAPTLNAEPAYTKGTSNTITWPAVTDPVTGTCEYYAEYTTDNTWGTITGNSGWIPDRSWTVSGLTSGTTYYYRVKARDLAGNPSGVSPDVSSTQDAVAPVFDTSTYTPAAGSWSKVASLTVSVKVTDALAGINTSAFVFTVDGNPPDAGTQAYNGVTGVLSGTFSGLATGTHTVYVKAFDNADAGGNWAETTWTFGVDLEGPVSSNTQPHGWITNSSPTVSADYSAGPSGLDTSVNTVRLRRSDYTDPGTPDTKKDGTWTATGAPEYLTGTVSYAPGALTDGKWNVGLDLQDKATNSSSSGWFFQIDTTPPAAPGSASTTTPTNNVTPTWTWGASAGDPVAPDLTAGSGLDHYEVKIGTTVGGDDILAATNVANVTTWVTDLDPSTPGNQGFADDGTYYISVRAVDALGNASNWVGDATTKVVVDTVAPTLGSNAPTGFINDNSPTLQVNFDDTVEATVVSGYGSTTTFTLDGGSVLPVTGEPPSGAATGTITKTTSALAQGSHTVSITVQDKAGNSTTLGTIEAPWTFFVDTQLPTPPTVTVTSPTNDTTPTFTFNGASDPEPSSGLASYTIEVWSGGAKVRGPYSVAYAVDPFSWTVPDADALTPDGSYQIRVWAVDAAGNVSATYGSATVVIDTARPVLANGSPTGYGTNTTPTISADFTDVGVGLDASETALTLTYDGTPTVITAGFTGVPGYADGLLSTNIQYTPGSALADGEYTADMVAYDLAGNKTTPVPTLQWTFNIDTTPPTDPGSPVAGNAHDSNGKWYINSLRPTFSWTASEDRPAPDGTDGSGLSHYWFQFGLKAEKDLLVGDAWVGALVDESGGDPDTTPGTGYVAPTPGVSVQQWTPSSDLPLTANVEYSARVKAFDEVGNDTLWIDPPIIYDPNPPTAPGAPTTTSPTNDATPTWSWTGSTDDISGVELYHIQIRHAGSADWDVLDMQLDIPDALNPGDETWVQGLQLESGDYEIRVRAMDVAGNYSDWSDEGSVTIHATPPDPPVMTPEDDTKDLPLVEWSEVEDPGYTVSYVLEYATNEAFSGATQVACATNSYSFTALTDGTYWMRAKAVVLVNDMGTPADPSDDLTIETGWAVPISFTYDAGLPSVPAALQVVTPATDNTPMFVWNASEDETSGVAFYRLQYTAEGGAPVTVDTTAPEWTATSVWADGFYDVQVKAIDAVGNESEYCTAIDVMIDTQAPDTPELTELEEYTPGTSVTVEWGAVGDYTSGVAYYEVQMGSEEEPFEVDKTAIVEEDGSEAYSYTFDNLEPGATYYYRVRAVDEVGNASEWSSVEFSTQYPAAPTMPGLAAEPEFTAGLTNTIYWQAADGADDYDVQVSTVEDFSSIAKDLPDVGNVTQLLVTGLTDGTKYFYRVRGHAHVGDVDEVAGPWSNVVSSTQDNSGPAAPSALKVLTPASDSRPAFMWNASDDGEAGSGVATYELQYKREGTDWESDDVVSIVTREAQWVAESAFAEGSYLVRVRATDAVGNAGGFSEEVAFTIDTTPPTVVFINPTEAEGVTYDITTSSTIIAEITGEFDQHKVWLSIDGGGEVTPTAIVGSTVYYVVGVPFTADEHTVAIRVQDAAGNEGSAEVTFTVEAYRQGFGFGRLRFENTVEPED